MQDVRSKKHDTLIGYRPFVGRYVDVDGKIDKDYIDLPKFETNSLHNMEVDKMIHE